MLQSKLSLSIWMNIPSFYQSDLFQALNATGEVDLEVIFARELPSDRLQLGWKPDLSGYRHHFLNKRLSVFDATQIAWRQRHRIHIMNGIWAEPAFASALSTLRLLNSHYAVYAETVDPSFPRSTVKTAIKNIFGSWIGYHPKSALLAISHLSRDFYAPLGFQSDKIYDFGYFQKAYEKPVIRRNQTNTEVIFMGQLIERKRVDMLLTVLFPLFDQFRQLRLVLVGKGDKQSELEQRVFETGHSDRIEFVGVLPSDQVRDRIAQADILVLPSHFDGWGIVINEALSVGVPVIVSDQCGAADLISSGKNGFVFRAEDPEALKHCLQEFLTQSSEDRNRMRAEVSIARDAISADSAAVYLVACLHHMLGQRDEKPSPPWQTALSSSVIH